MTEMVQMSALKIDRQRNLEFQFRVVEKTAEADRVLVVFPESMPMACYGDLEVVKYARSAMDCLLHTPLVERTRRHRVVIAYRYDECARGLSFDTHAPERAFS